MEEVFPFGCQPSFTIRLYVSRSKECQDLQFAIEFLTVDRGTSFRYITRPFNQERGRNNFRCGVVQKCWHWIRSCQRAFRGERRHYFQSISSRQDSHGSGDSHKLSSRECFGMNSLANRVRSRSRFTAWHLQTTAFHRHHSCIPPWISLSRPIKINLKRFLISFPQLFFQTLVQFMHIGVAGERNGWNGGSQADVNRNIGEGKKSL